MARTLTRPRVEDAAWDRVLVLLSIAHAVVLATTSSIPLVGVALWWDANTIAHNFIHRPFFRSRGANDAYSMYLSLVLGIPQSVWRARHLAHHAGEAKRIRVGRAHASAETVLIVMLWSVLSWFARRWFLTVYVPGCAAGLCLCFLQGHYEHARGTTSHYGWLYNILFFNDGYHVEHHRWPNLHWTRLPERRSADAHPSGWPPILRWLDANAFLEALERIVLRSPALQRFVLGRHERACRAILTRMPAPSRITIVGGGLFPRTALVLKTLLPDASLLIVDANAEHLAVARSFLGGAAVRFRHALYDPGVPDESDLVVIPLAFVGDRPGVYRRPPARAVLVHDWIWARTAPGVRVSWLLLKRLNLVQA